MMARRFAVEALRGAPAETRETVALMVSELASKCVLHTDTPVRFVDHSYRR